MKIRNKTLCVVGSALFGLILLSLAAGRLVLESIAEQTEKTLALERLERAFRTIGGEIKSLGRSAVDYASWDDTYACASSYDERFIRDNLTDATLLKNRFGAMVLADVRGNTLFKRAMDLRGGTARPFPEAIDGIVLPGSRLLRHSDVQSTIDGLLDTADGTFMIVSRPILTSMYTGPINGSLVLARLMDPSEVGRLSESVLTPMQILPIRDELVPAALREGGHLARTTVPDGPIMHSFMVLKDIFGKPSLVLHVTTKRTHEAIAFSGFWVFALSISAVGVAVLALSTFLLNRLVLSRLFELFLFVRSTGSTRSFSERMRVDGSDEIASLSESFNEMLDRMEAAIKTRREAEKALSESERVFQTLLDNLQGMAYQCDAKSGNPVFFSTGCTPLTGYAPGVFVLQDGLKYAELIAKDDLTRVEDEIRACMSERRQYQITYRITCADGSQKYVLEQGMGIYGGGGDALFREGFITDITKHRLAEDEKQRMEMQLLQAQKLESLGILTGGVAHDFNNLLMTVLGNADMAIGEVSAGSSAANRLYDIKEAAQHATDLCRQMLAYSGRGKVSIELLDLADVVCRMKPILAASVSKKHEVAYSLDGRETAMEGDVSQVRQVVMNLVINASEAIGDAKGTIGVKTCGAFVDPKSLSNPSPRAVQPGRYAIFEVSDTGCGMAPETVKKVFDPFFSTKFTGRGLGLSAVMGIVGEHRGCICVSSELGRGSTFAVYFPATDRKPQPPIKKAEEELWTSDGIVMLVDDEKRVLEAAARMLERLGFTVIKACNGREAVGLFAEHRESVRCVVLDLTMPEMDGRETFLELSKIDPETPVILSSGYCSPESAQDAGAMDTAAFIAKPYSLKSLSTILRQVLGG